MDTPLDQTTYASNGTRDRFRYVHLQRLANPMVGWDAETNPYRTVDTLPVDLHVFNGAGGADPGLGGGGGAALTNRFGTRERGEVVDPTDPPAVQLAQRRQRLLWSNRLDRAHNVTDTAISSAGDLHFYSFHLEDPTTPIHEETLGETLVDTGYSTIINHSYDYTNNPVFNDEVEFPSLTWNNRPYVSQYELMLVPRTSSSQLLSVFGINTGPNVDYVTDVADQDRFDHLMNFFRATDAGQASADLHQLFDYIHVPTKFTDFKDFKDLQLFADDSLSFKPPYNFLPTFREPGRMNLNTIYTPEIFNGLKGGAELQGGHHGDATWPNFVASRRGANLTTGSVSRIFDTTTNQSYFANPFRSGEGGNLTAANPVRNGIDASLMRSDDNTGAGLRNKASFDAFDPAGVFNTETTTNTLHNPDRHPYLRYKNRIRLGNLATTRSNVFSVWITVGYFEFNEETGELGAELGSESGQVERHRAFYMVDRSIPVGFEPGQNHNVDKAVMLRRIIE